MNKDTCYKQVRTKVSQQCHNKYDKHYPITLSLGSFCLYSLDTTQEGDKTFFFGDWNPLRQLFTALQRPNSVTTDVHCLHAEAIQLHSVHSLNKNTNATLVFSTPISHEFEVKT